MARNYLYRTVLDSGDASSEFGLDAFANLPGNRDSSFSVVLHRDGSDNFTVQLQVGVEDNDGTVYWVTHIELKQGRVDDTNQFTHIPGARYRFQRTAGANTITAFVI